MTEVTEIQKQTDKYLFRNCDIGDSAKVILLLHGLGGGKDLFCRLAEHCRVISV